MRKGKSGRQGDGAMEMERQEVNTGVIDFPLISIVAPSPLSPRPPVALLLFTHVIIRGQERWKLIISCRHIVDQFSRKVTIVSTVSAVIEALSSYCHREVP
jgi:hypothetical protein